MRSSFLILFVIIFLPLFALDGCAFSDSSPESKNDNGSKDVARFCGWSTEAPCSNNSDCEAGGCSGQVCLGIREDIVTTCEWTDCYDAEKFSMACGCVEGKCKWFEGGNQSAFGEKTVARRNRNAADSTMVAPEAMSKW